MIKLENTVTPSAAQWMAVIRGMRNAMNSWDRIDSEIFNSTLTGSEVMPGVETFDYTPCEPFISIGKNDHELMMKLVKGGPVHAKYRRMIPVYVDITAPLLWWKEFDTYKVGTVANSCSTMHKIHDKPFTRSDFTNEHLDDEVIANFPNDEGGIDGWSSLNTLDLVICVLNELRVKFNETKDKKYWRAMIDILPDSFNQKRTVFMNYEVLANIYESRQGHKLDEWHTFLDWIKTLPYHEIITNNK